MIWRGSRGDKGRLGEERKRSEDDINIVVLIYECLKNKKINEKRTAF